MADGKYTIDYTVVSNNGKVKYPYRYDESTDAKARGRYEQALRATEGTGETIKDVKLTGPNGREMPL